jgi:hypothetical protein
VAGVTTVAHLPELLRGAAAGRDVPAMRKTAEQLTEITRTFTRFAERLVAVAQEMERIGKRSLPETIVGTTGVTAGAGIKAVETALTGAGQAARRAGTALTALAAVRETAERRDIAGTDELARLTGQIGAVVTAYHQDPGAAWLPARITELRDAAHAAILQRVGADATLLAAADTATRALYELAGQARLAKLGPSPLSALDELVIAYAGAGDAQGPVLTAAIAGRAADRLSLLSEGDAARVDQVLRQAQSPSEQAYVLKALAAGYDVNQVADFAAKIHPFGNDPAWLDQHLAPLDTAVPAGDGPGLAAATEYGQAMWTQGDNPQCSAYSVITARAQVDPVYALGLTAGGQPGSELDTPASFAARLSVEGQRVYDDARGQSGIPAGTEGSPVGHTADTELGPRIGVVYQPEQIQVPADPDLVTLMARTVSDGTPVPLAVSEPTGEFGHALMVINHHNGSFQFFDPALGSTFWATDDQFSQGRLDRAEPLTRPVPQRVYLPTGR